MSFSAQGTIESSKGTTSGAASSNNAKSASSSGGLTILKQDSGKNFSEMNMTLYSAVGDFGAAGLTTGEMVKFTAPRPGWKLKQIQVAGWSIINNTTKKYPPDRNFLVEVRDKNADLLYKFADDQNLYFASSVGPQVSGIDIPPLAVTDVFYIVFYDRGAMLIGAEPKNGTGNSYFVSNGRVLPAEFKDPKINETIKINWMIRAIGE